MNETIGATLTLALGVAISPVPIIATILMLLSPTSKRTGTSFLLGWLVGITVSISLFTALATLMPPATAIRVASLWSQPSRRCSDWASWC